MENCISTNILIIVEAEEKFVENSGVRSWELGEKKPQRDMEEIMNHEW
jgi:hypothetical protein